MDRHAREGVNKYGGPVHESLDNLGELISAAVGAVAAAAVVDIAAVVGIAAAAVDTAVVVAVAAEIAAPVAAVAVAHWCPLDG